jgi:hypothetical protein
MKSYLLSILVIYPINPNSPIELPQLVFDAI